MNPDTIQISDEKRYAILGRLYQSWIVQKELVAVYRNDNNTLRARIAELEAAAQGSPSDG